MHIQRLGHIPFTSFAAATSFVACASLLLGCASEAILSTDHLPVRRVIVYRNGVAYFERGGHVDGGRSASR